jgi:hypothetical protein
VRKDLHAPDDIFGNTRWADYDYLLKTDSKQIMDTPDAICDAISKLKFLSFVQKNQKINTRKVEIYNNNWYDVVYRTIIHPENRSDTIHFVNNIIESGVSLFERSNEQTQGVLIECINNTKTGLDSLIYTYRTDPYMVARLEAIQIRIELFMTDSKNAGVSSTLKSTNPSFLASVSAPRAVPSIKSQHGSM